MASLVENFNSDMDAEGIRKELERIQKMPDYQQPHADLGYCTCGTVWNIDAIAEQGFVRGTCPDCGKDAVVIEKGDPPMLDTTFPPMPEHISDIQSRHANLMEQTREAIGYGCDITAPQALIVMALGKETVRVGDLVRLGYYAGTNATYNLNALEAAGYVNRQIIFGDRRQKFVALTDKGLDLCIRLRRMLAREMVDV